MLLPTPSLLLVIAAVFAALSAYSNAVTLTNDIYKAVDVCNTANFDYDVEEESNEGFSVSFEDKTSGAFVAYVDLVWSTLIPNAKDSLGSPVPSESQTIRLKKLSNGKWQDMIDYPRVLGSLETLAGDQIDQLLDKAKLRFFFKFWVIDNEGNNQLCNSPWTIL